MKILVLCTGNSCRSQMAEAFLKSFDGSLEIFSAGTDPAKRVHPKAIQVMSEMGISMKGLTPKNVGLFLDEDFDYLITVCGEANETCHAFSGNVRNRLHKGFKDPARLSGTEEEILEIFRKVRDEIRDWFYQFYLKENESKN